MRWVYNKSYVGRADAFVSDIQQIDERDEKREYVKAKFVIEIFVIKNQLG
jgi:hypothetical protein